MINIKGNIVKKSVARVVTPFIQLFALYVIVHGDSGPGGGFQGGVILGASVILYAIIFGAEAGRRWVSQTMTDIFNSIGVLIYAGVGVVALFVGGKFLVIEESELFRASGVEGFSGSFLIESKELLAGGESDKKIGETVGITQAGQA